MVRFSCSSLFDFEGAGGLFGPGGACLIINDQDEIQLSGVDPVFEQYAKDEFFIPSGSAAELQAPLIDGSDWFVAGSSEIRSNG